MKFTSASIGFGLVLLQCNVEARNPFAKKPAPPPPPKTLGGTISSIFKSKSEEALDVKGGSSVKPKKKKQKKVSPPPPPPVEAKPSKEEAAAVIDTKPAPLAPSRGAVDSLQLFQSDVTKVLKELRSEYNDPTVNKIFHSKRRPTFAVTWTHEMWEQQTSRWRFLGLFLHWYSSALLKRVLPQLTVLMLWTVAAMRIVDNQTTVLSNIKFPMTSLSLVSGFVGSLLALRTNQGLSRLMEARQIFGKCVHYTRDMSSLISHFVYHKDPQVGLKLARHLTIFGWLLKNFLRGQKASGGNDEDIIRTMLPNKADADYVLQQRKMPVAVVQRLRQGLHHCSEAHMLTTAEELSIDHTIQAMDAAIMMTERIVASPIPPLFTSHAGRLLIFYLFFLPIALHSSGTLNTIGTFVTVLAVGYAMLGLDEISYLMEQPFKVSPLYHLCKNSMRDVADSFCLHPPDIKGANRRYHAHSPQPYWTDGAEDSFQE